MVKSNSKLAAVVIGALTLWASDVGAQALASIDLNQYHQAVLVNKPLLTVDTLYNLKLQYERRLARRSYLPTLTAEGQANYLSEVFELPIKIPGANIESPSKLQYKAYAQLSQTLYDGGAANLQATTAELSNESNQTSLRITDRQLLDIADGVFFDICNNNAMVEVERVRLANLDNLLSQIKQMVKSGVAKQSDLLETQIEQTDALGKIASLQAKNQSLYQDFKLLSGIQIDTATLLQPNTSFAGGDPASRPEVRLNDISIRLAQTQYSAEKLAYKPKVSAFVQTGLGNPNPLNMLETEQPFYYMAGLRFSWNLYDFGYLKNRIQTYNIESQILTKRRDDILRSVKVQEGRLLAQKTELEKLISSENEKLKIVGEWRRAKEAQYKSGVATLTEWLNTENTYNRSVVTIKLYKLKIDQINNQLNNLYLN